MVILPNLFWALLLTSRFLNGSAALMQERPLEEDHLQEYHVSAQMKGGFFEEGVQDDFVGLGRDHQKVNRLLGECGNEGEACCEAGTLYGEGYCLDENRLRCNSSGQCERCGGRNQMCCHSNQDGLVCNSERFHCNKDSETCETCGRHKEPCCARGTDGVLGCWDSGYQACDETRNPPKCFNCGGEEQICCSGPGVIKQCDSAYAACDAGTNTCQSCGGRGEPCCVGDNGSTMPGKGRCDDDSYRSCVADENGNGVCTDCGGKGQPCCMSPGSKMKCDSEHLFCNAHTECESCGGHDEICCPNVFDASIETRPPYGTCDNNNYRTCMDVDGAGICKECGSIGQPCCYHAFGGAGICDSFYSTCLDGQCSQCGLSNQPCCNGNKCNNDGYRACNLEHSSGTPTCESCGGHNQLSCNGKGAGFTSCDSEFYNIGEDGTCTRCGGENEPCCESNNKCQDSRFKACVEDASQDSFCRRCGGADEPCCESASGNPVCDFNWMNCLVGDGTLSENMPGANVCRQCGGEGQQCCLGPDACQFPTLGCHPDINECIRLNEFPSASPSSQPSGGPTSSPSGAPSVSMAPSNDPTSAPSISPSNRPTSRPTLSLVPSNAPTISASPTSFFHASCPPTSSAGNEIPPSILTVEKSDADTLCTIVLVDGDKRVPVARSYDGNEWHQYSGAYSGVQVTCGPNDCTFTIDTPEQGRYILSSTSGYSLSNLEIAARFFESSTFGMTKSDIVGLANSMDSSGENAIAAWIADQMDETQIRASSHREFIRRHTNGIFEGSSRLGQVTQPCERETTYRKFAFLNNYYEKDAVVSTITTDSGIVKKKIEIDGVVITLVDDITFKDGTSFGDGSFEVCSRLPEYIGGRIRLKHPSKGCQDAYFNGNVYGNPPVDLRGITLGNVIELNPSEAVSMDESVYGDLQMLKIIAPLEDVVCDSILDGPGLVPAVYAKFNNEWFIHSPRWKLRENTISNPLLDGGGSIVNATTGGDSMYTARCANAPRSFLNEASCFISYDSDVCSSEDYTEGGLVCGSPGEVANDISLGGAQKAGNAFDSRSNYGETSSFNPQKKLAWTGIILNAQDQLRQRTAWVLSQILVINEQTLGTSETERYGVFYDIFVRNAFGNYRDVLKEVSFNGMMSKFLSYYGSRSTQYHFIKEGVLRHPDENYAREIMQLFSVGLNMLNEDGTTMRDEKGATIKVYTNDEIREYSRVWTGFWDSNSRGNIEDARSSVNLIDPLKILPKYRDYFPKLGLLGQYIGDGYPLCADLPEKHFLNEGAKYRLLGHTSFPELQEEQDREEWIDDSSAKTLKADPAGGLFSELCNGTSGSCNYQPVVKLTSKVACTNIECDIDSIRTVEVEENIFYEYIRPPCSKLLLYPNATKVKKRNGQNRPYMCADPRTEEASTVCCGFDQLAHRYDIYRNEPVKLATAQSRCDLVPGKDICENANIQGCDDYHCSNPYFWTSESCQIKIKIDSDLRVAVVHNVPEERNHADSLVNVDTKTFFRVHWNDEATVEKLLDECGTPNLPCTFSPDNHCLCDVSVSENLAFQYGSPLTREDVLGLTFGAFQYPSDSPKSLVPGTNDVWFYGSTPFSIETVFEVLDNSGRMQLRKNMRSTTSLFGTTPILTFRTPVHMMSLVEENERDAIYETEAAIDHYFYHPNTPVFIGIRFAQRLGISNPSPRYIKIIADAFRTGSYNANGQTFGSTGYGDLAATVAAVLLDSEARNTLLEADPFHGSFLEPLLKLTKLMRSMEFEPASEAPIPSLERLEHSIKQMVYEAPDVFSFFHPGFVPDGIISKTSLVSPEAAVYNTPEIIAGSNGFQSLVKYGLTRCYDGFGDFLEGQYTKCWKKDPGQPYDAASGHLSYSPENSLNASAVVDDLALLMTSGRLSKQGRSVVEQAYTDELAENGHERASIKAQQLILTTPEFHTNGRVKPVGGGRTTPTLPFPTGNSYKSVIFLMLAGGCDSFNMIVPHSCTKNNLVQQYEEARGELKFTDAERTKVVDAEGQPCEQFALHPELHTIEKLYNEGDLSFFMNTGVLNAETTKKNFKHVTATNLFSHDSMQYEAARGDPFDSKIRSGYLGRLADVLAAKGFQPNSVSIDSSSVAVTGYTSATVSPLVVDRDGIHLFHNRPSSEADIKNEAFMLNGQFDQSSSSIFGETWSSRFRRALWETEVLDGFLENVNLPSEDELPDENLAKQLRTILKLQMIRDQRGADRDVFFASIGGFDTHDDMKERLQDRFQELDDSLAWYVAEAKQQGLFENTTIVAVSDFGRTLTPNSGAGSDHAWGGNYWIAGGGVKGGQMLCQYPEDLTDEGPLNVGRGRMVPTCSWESIWHGVTQWMLDGEFDEAIRDEVMPNALKTGAPLYNHVDLYD